ncbi:KAP family P-loop NTPase fold protein [Thalassoglobus polymorphus]|uniref:KAP family P-loop domain protein n=1 Tax=Thalassoglobus polymorphus TaxID=2527994 RepID=A0A517QTS0_9PLAN|nr:P-loop NTPase fold protein [Thalassoglobus polymorphus]QDT34978.1 KAP family P-loop domain protein [Thalassoglobus polymorphus]
MKITPPIPEIPDDNPYCNDLFNRREFGNSLKSLFCNVSENVVLCVDAPWGDGKTTFAKMWIADLLKDDKQCIYFDAFQHDYSADPLVAFSAEIIRLVEEQFEDSNTIQVLKEDFKKKAKRIAANLITAGARFGIKALTLGIIKDTDIEAFESIKEDIAEDSSNAISSMIGAAFDEYVASKELVAEFHEKLSALGNALKEEQSFPLLIVVDELDRCRPDFALSLIERTKHLFATENVSFLLMANIKQLESSVKYVYGNDVDATNYLQKFFSLVTILPKDSRSQDGNDFSRYCEHLIRHYFSEDIEGLHSRLSTLFLHFQFSFREMERCVALLSIYYAQLPQGRLTSIDVISFLGVAQIKCPEVVDALMIERLSYSELLSKTRLTESTPEKNRWEPKPEILSRLKYLLMTDAEFAAVDEGDRLLEYGRWLTQFGMARHKVIPFLCSEVRQFRTSLHSS